MVVDIILVPLWQGSGHLGADLGPSKLMNNGLKELIESHGHIIGSISTCSVPNTYYSEKDLLLKYKTSVVSCCDELQEYVKESLKHKHFPLIIGGDHALAIGSIAGINQIIPTKDLSVIWIDAHTDINSSKGSTSHNIHGMPVGVCLGLEESNAFLDFNYGDKMLEPSNLYYIGARSVDEPEKEIINKLGIKVYGMDDIHTKGIDNIVNEIFSNIKTPYIHISFDVDFMDPSYFPYTGVPVSNGPTLEETKLCLETLMKSDKIISFDLVEYNPEEDKDNKGVEICKDLISITLKHK